MHPPFASHVAKYRHLFAPLLYSVLSAVANVHTPVQHALLVTTLSWLVVWLPAVLWVGLYSNSSKEKRRAAWVAGGLLGLSAVWDRVACDREGVWVTKALLPILTALISENDALAKHLPVLERPALEPKALGAKTPGTEAYWLLAVLTASASVALATYTVPTTFVLGLSSAIFAAVALVVFESTVQAATNSVQTQRYAALRDVAVAIIVVCGVASLLIESSLTTSTISWEPVYRGYSREWRDVHNFRMLQRFLWMIPVHAILNVVTFFMISQHGAVHTSLLAVFSFVCAKLLLAPSFTNLVSSFVYDSAAIIYFLESPSVSINTDMRRSKLLKRFFFTVTALAVGAFLFRNLSHSSEHDNPPNDVLAGAESSLGPITLDMSKRHPAAQLIDAAEKQFQDTLKKQSKSLAGAVQEYRRRHGIAPPPHFDKWYEFATRNEVVMMDEYDTINEMLLPFWALKPSTIRSRIANALGHEDSALIAIAIRHGAVENFQNGEEWQQQATIGMMKDFVQYLPDMDLGFNMHDEPRVVVPNELLSSMVSKARDGVLARIAKNPTPRNAFSARPEDMNDGTRFLETSTTKFNRFAHQQTWTHSRLSCPSSTQAQTYEDFSPDNLTAYAASPLGHIYNTTAFSDICNSPSLSSTYGFFERPNAFSITHELTPIFSQSKLSSFQDILYPSPWYWMGKVGYDASHDTSWENKTNALYWRGSTTGGFSRNGGWRRQHRQHVVGRLNAPDTAQILVQDDKTHVVKDVERKSLAGLIDVSFSHIGQCDPGDCDAQQEFFKTTERVDGQDAWYYRHLLDMDGNAFSGRFYSFLKSRSLTYKMALFREWHAEWLRPWVHYVPLSLKGEEHLDLVRWFGGGEGWREDSEGAKKAKEIAERSTQWHDKVLRNVDFEAWFFRLLLEYGRVVDDKREEIGYAGP